MSMRGHYRKSHVGSKQINESKKLKRGTMKRAVGVDGQGERDEQGGENERKTHGKMEKREEKRDFNIISFKMFNREITANLKKK